MSTTPTLPDNSLAWLVDNERINFYDRYILSEHVKCFKVGCEKPKGADEKAPFCTPERWDMHMKRCRFTNTPEADILALGFGPERGRYADSIYETAMSLREMSKIRDRLLSESAAKPQLLCWDWDGTISVIEGMLKDVYLALDSFNSKATDNDIDGSLELQDLVLYYLGGQQRIDAFLETFRLANSLGIKQIVLTANMSTNSIQHLLNHLFEEEGYDFQFLEQDVRYIFDPQWSAAGADVYEQTKIQIIASHLNNE